MKNFILKHKMLSGVIGVVLLFVIYNAFWLIYTGTTYGKLSEGMIEDPKWVSYHIIEDSGYIYSVKYPNYLSLTGNVAISSPDDRFSMIIWPRIFKDEYGIMLADEENNSYEIMVNKDGEAQIADNQAILDAHRDQVSLLLDKASSKWPELMK